MDEPRPRTLTILSRHGLANRLRMLVSGLVIARASNRRLTMFWTPSRACGCTFSALFQNQWDVKNEHAPEHVAWLDLGKLKTHEFPDLLASADSDLAIKYYGWLIQPALFPHHANLFQHCAKLFTQLEPLPEIQARIDAFRKQFFHAPVIGVHLRRGDFVWAHPESTNNLHAAIRTVEHYLAHTPNALIFLCTDDGAIHPMRRTATRFESIREKFIQRFGVRVMPALAHNLDRDTPEAIQDALVELWLLRQTDFFVGTVNSSFSELAVLGREIPMTMTGHPENYYLWLERFLAWTRLNRVVDRMSIAKFGHVVPFTTLWFRYRDDGRKRLRQIGHSQSDKSPVHHQTENNAKPDF